METLRCPTCLGVLPDGGQKRCPSCRTRLGTRGRPIVLGESNRISARPKRRERRRAAKSGREADPIVAPAPIESRADTKVAPPPEPHPRRARRLVAAKQRNDELPPFDTETRAVTVEPEIVVAAPVVDTKIVFVPEIVAAVVAEPEPEVAEPEVAEPEVAEPEVAEPEVAEAPVADTKIVFVPVVVQAVVAQPHEPEPEAGADEEPVLDITEVAETEPREIVIPEVVFEAEVAASAEDQQDAGSQLFSVAARKPRVKKIAKDRRGWVVDYVVPDPESEDAGT